MNGTAADPVVDVRAVARAILARGQAGDPVTLAVVGPSGVGKDSVMTGAMRVRDELRLIRRVITRPTDDSREAHDSMGEAEFAAAQAAGRFALTWRAHGLCYGIPAERAGQRGIALVNLSRTVLEAADGAFPRLGVVALTASPECLARRLAARDGGDPAAIIGRLARDVCLAFDPARLLRIDNSGVLGDAVARLVMLCDAISDQAGAA